MKEEARACLSKCESIKECLGRATQYNTPTMKQLEDTFAQELTRLQQEADILTVRDIQKIRLALEQIHALIVELLIK